MVSAQEVREIRSRLGISQRKLASLLGVSPAAVARWERGDLAVGPAHERLLRLLEHAPGERVSAPDWLALLAAGAAMAAFLWLVFGKKGPKA
ncbi:MAG: helix-turn-helix domain-containing protein [Planctomycetota bacterium]